MCGHSLQFLHDERVLAPPSYLVLLFSIFLCLESLEVSGVVRSTFRNGFYVVHLPPLIALSSIGRPIDAISDRILSPKVRVAPAYCIGVFPRGLDLLFGCRFKSLR
jgi:hypothetical protein